MSKRLKRFAPALGNHDDYSYNVSIPAGGRAARKTKQQMRAIVTRRQRRQDNKIPDE